ncbi:MAG: vitamin B12 dependent methionine synthase, partial [Thermoleophilia bacterium]|nr:vitamin B12 dependent methionine synthase [Thermoleophilia bacterium]
MTILDPIPFALDAERLMEKFRVDPESEHAAAFREFVARVQDAAKPKAIYDVAYIDEKGDDFVVVQGVRFTSRTLRRHLTEAERVFP